MTINKMITAEQVLEWHGSDHNMYELAQMVADMVNGDYPVELAKQDLEDYDYEDETNK